MLWFLVGGSNILPENDLHSQIWSLSSFGPRAAEADPLQRYERIDLVATNRDDSDCLISTSFTRSVDSGQELSKPHGGSMEGGLMIWDPGEP